MVARKCCQSNPELSDVVEPPSVHISSSLRSWKIDRRRVSDLVAHMAGRLGVAHLEVHVSFVGPAAMRRINRQFREKDKSTDVLSFPQMEWHAPKLVQKPGKAGKSAEATKRNRGMLRGTRGGLVAFGHESVLGDMIICLDAAEKNASEDGNPVAKEVCFLLAHGMLHLCGHDHQNPAEKKLMFGEQAALMEQLEGSWRSCVRRTR